MLIFNCFITKQNPFKAVNLLLMLP